MEEEDGPSERCAKCTNNLRLVTDGGCFDGAKKECYHCSGFCLPCGFGVGECMCLHNQQRTNTHNDDDDDGDTTIKTVKYEYDAQRGHQTGTTTTEV